MSLILPDTSIVASNFSAVLSVVSKSKLTGNSNPSSIQDASLSAARTSALAPIVSAMSPMAGTSCKGESENKIPLDNRRRFT